MNTKRSWSIPIVSCLTLALVTILAPVLSPGEETETAAPDGGPRTNILDGKQFSGVTGEKGKKGHHEDTLSFRNGMFTSSASFPYGFGSSPYTAAAEGDIITFRAETVSPKLGKMQWQGTLKGETLEVTYSWTKERWLWTTFRQYWFKGRLVKP